MKSVMKIAAMCAVAMSLVALSACETMMAVTEGVLMACQDNPEGCDEVF